MNEQLRVLGVRYSAGLSCVFFTGAYVYTSATTTATTTTTPVPITCAKCATNKAGKRTCCARGGSWLKNCGNPGDSKFDHAWDEGIQACEGKLVCGKLMRD